MNSILLLFITSLAMFLGSYLFGTIPLCFKLSDSKLSSIALLGVGLLTGTALGVIVPEGIEAVIKAAGAHEHSDEDSEATNQFEMEQIGNPRGTFNSLMSHVPNTPRQSPIPVSRVMAATNWLRSKLNVFPPIFIGIFAHGIADGFALGSALVDSVDKSVGMTVFIALILHKAPEAFGLAATLLRLGYGRIKVRKLLLVYSVCAPVGAITTNFLLRFIEISFFSKETEFGALGMFSGYVLLFSGGMLVFVALCHALPEAIEAANNSHSTFPTPTVIPDVTGTSGADSSLHSHHNHRGVPDILPADLQLPSSLDTALHIHHSQSEAFDETRSINDQSHGFENNAQPIDVQAKSLAMPNSHPSNSHTHSHVSLSAFHLMLLVGGIFFPLLLTIGHAH
ncbi:Zinc transporter ZIP9 [Smittium mucronatum]|uniref:Zinc transporter ZIP9 n=1 Tax=Smittium mucronatum TaxID=133383 RepID=A0A1R0H6Q9_9FUNG|nr:Zinc transporter ZIP9 [Smittium mucronatum]